MTSLAFIAPLLLTYEIGMVLKVPLAVRNGADVWMRYRLERLGFGQYFLLPLLTVGILLAWHYTTHHAWRVSLAVLYGMAVESLLLAIGLRLLLQLQGTLLQSLPGTLGAIPAISWRRASCVGSAPRWGIWGRASMKNCSSG